MKRQWTVNGRDLAGAETVGYYQETRPDYWRIVGWKMAADDDTWKHKITLRGAISQRRIEQLGLPLYINGYDHWFALVCGTVEDAQARAVKEDATV